MVIQGYHNFYLCTLNKRNTLKLWFVNQFDVKCRNVLFFFFKSKNRFIIIPTGLHKKYERYLPNNWTLSRAWPFGWKTPSLIRARWKKRQGVRSALYASRIDEKLTRRPIDRDSHSSMSTSGQTHADQARQNVQSPAAVLLLEPRERWTARRMRPLKSRYCFAITLYSTSTARRRYRRFHPIAGRY